VRSAGRVVKRLGEMADDVFDQPVPEVSKWQLALDQLSEYDAARAEARLLRDLNLADEEALD
jgi:hypothetical protein